MIKFTQKDKRKHWEVLNKLSKKIKKGEKGIRSKYGDYSLCYYPEHPRCGKNGLIPTHVLIVEYFENRFLNTGGGKSNVVVHHKNQRTVDNRYANLQVMTRSRHLNLHRDLRLKERSVKLSYRNKAWLYRNYIIKGYTIREIAKKCRCSTYPINQNLKKFGYDKKSKFGKK